MCSTGAETEDSKKAAALGFQQESTVNEKRLR
jgi:hypothetical protein